MGAHNPHSIPTIHIVDPVQERHYALSEDAELQMRILRDGLRAMASMARGDDVDDRPLPDAVGGSDIAAIFDVFGIACGAIIETARIAGPSTPLKGRN